MAADRLTRDGVRHPDHLARFPQNLIRLMEDPGQIFGQWTRLLQQRDSHPIDLQGDPREALEQRVMEPAGQPGPIRQGGLEPGLGGCGSPAAPGTLEQKREAGTDRGEAQENRRRVERHQSR
jgi:hypothetical protein